MSIYLSVIVSMTAVFFVCSMAFYGVYELNLDGWNLWQRRTCIECTKIVVDPIVPEFCKAILYLQEPISDTSMYWTLGVCQCDDFSCLQKYQMNSTEVTCWFQAAGNYAEHNVIQAGSHPGTNPNTARTVMIVFIGLTVVFTIIGMILYKIERKKCFRWCYKSESFAREFNEGYNSV